jgi:hypothetical protein
VFHRRKKYVQGQVLDGGVGLQKVAQTFGHREHPLPNRQARNDVVGEMSSGLDHAAGVAGRADTASLAGQGDQKVVTAAGTSGAGEAVGQDAAFEIAAEFPLDVGRGRTARFVLYMRTGYPFSSTALQLTGSI